MASPTIRHHLAAGRPYITPEAHHAAQRCITGLRRSPTSRPVPAGSDACLAASDVLRRRRKVMYASQVMQRLAAQYIPERTPYAPRHPFRPGPRGPGGKRNHLFAHLPLHQRPLEGHGRGGGGGGHGPRRRGADPGQGPLGPQLHLRRGEGRVSLRPPSAPAAPRKAAAPHGLHGGGHGPGRPARRRGGGRDQVGQRPHFEREEDLRHPDRERLFSGRAAPIRGGGHRPQRELRNRGLPPGASGPGRVVEDGDGGELPSAQPGRRHDRGAGPALRHPAAGRRRPLPGGLSAALFVRSGEASVRGLTGYVE